MMNKCLVTVYTSNGEKVSGIYIGTPEDFNRTFYQYKLHPKSHEFGINLRCVRSGGFIRIPVNLINESLLSVEPYTE